MPWVFHPSKDDILLANKGFSLDFLSLKHVFCHPGHWNPGRGGPKLYCMNIKIVHMRIYNSPQQKHEEQHKDGASCLIVQATC